METPSRHTLHIRTAEIQHKTPVWTEFSINQPTELREPINVFVLFYVAVLLLPL